MGRVEAHAGTVLARRTHVLVEYTFACHPVFPPQVTRGHEIPLTHYRAHATSAPDQGDAAPGVLMTGTELKALTGHSGYV